VTPPDKDFLTHPTTVQVNIFNISYVDDGDDDDDDDFARHQRQQWML